MHLGWFFCADILYRQTTMQRRNMWIRMSASIYFPSSPLYSGYPQFLALLGKSCFLVITVLSNSYLVYHGIPQFQSWSSSSFVHLRMSGVTSIVREHSRMSGVTDIVKEKMRSVSRSLSGEFFHVLGENSLIRWTTTNNNNNQQPTPSIWDKFKNESLMQLLVGVIYSLLVATVYLCLRALACSWALFCLTFISGCCNHWDY